MFAAQHDGAPVPQPAPQVPADGTDRLAAALDRLVERQVLSRPQADAVRAEVAAMPEPQRQEGPQRPEGMRRLLGEIAGYLGASFVVGATLLFLSEEWDGLGRAGRFSILAAMAVILFGSGVALRRHTARGGFLRPGDTARRRLASTLMTGAAAAAGFAAYAGLERGGAVADGQLWVDAASFVASVVGLAVVVTGYLLARSALGQLGSAVAAFAVCGTLLDLLNAEEAEALGLGMLLLGALWAVLAWRRLVAERRFGLAVAVTFGLLGAQTVAFGGDEAELFGYALTALVAAICFVAYARGRDWIVLAGGVAGATLVVPEVLYDVTDGSLGASGVMLVAGVTLLAGGLAGMRIRPHRR
jgi:hypothetical protein